MIKGIIKVEPTVRDLSKYFESPTHVTIRPLSEPARREIQAISADATRYATTQRKRSLDIDAIEQSMPAEVLKQIRDIKLADAHVEDNIEAVDGKGQKIPWGPDLWAELDEANPQILIDVVEKITDITYPEEDEGDPTSPAPSAGK